jgi:hypothetical protein
VNDWPDLSVMKIQKKECLIEAYIIFSPNIGAILAQSAKTLETANLSVVECYSVMQCLDNKIQQRIEDRFFSTATVKNLTV